MQRIHLESINWKCLGGTYRRKQTKFLHMPLNIIVSGKKMLERSHSYRLPSRIKYFSNSLQTNSTLQRSTGKEKAQSGKTATPSSPFKDAAYGFSLRGQSCIPSDTYSVRHTSVVGLCVMLGELVTD